MKDRLLFSVAAIVTGLGLASGPGMTAVSGTAAAGQPPAAPDAIAEFREVSRRLRAGTNRYFGTAPLVDAQTWLASPDLSSEARFDLLLKVAEGQLKEGEVDAAIAGLDSAQRIFDAGRAKLPPPSPPSGGVESAPSQNPDRGAWGSSRAAALAMARGVAFLRQGETVNCAARHTAQSCIVPIRGAGIHTLKEPSRRAIASLRELLTLRPGDLAARWLLTIAAMTIGEYPDGLSDSERIPPAAFQSPVDIGHFDDIAPALGVNSFSLAGGVAVEDFDDDGFLDIVTSTSDPDGPLVFYRNTGQGGFTDSTSGSGLEDQLGGLNLIAADYDNDGDPDLLVLRGGWLFGDGRIRKSLLRNDGPGRNGAPAHFTDVTRETGLAEPAYPTQSAVFADFDNDGDLDLFIANEGSGTPDEPGFAWPCQLFRNEMIRSAGGKRGAAVFTDVAAPAGVINERIAKGATAGDYDDDGDMDLYVSNLGENRLYRNDGGLHFTDVAQELGVKQPSGRSFSTWFFDYDNDGRLDLFVAAYDAQIADLAAEATGKPVTAGVPRLYRNSGTAQAPSFTDITRSMNLAHAWAPMGANFGDLDNDGFPDMYLGTGTPDYRALMPNVMLRNDAGRAFQDVTYSSGTGHLQKGHGVAIADLDNDGDEDIYHQLGGFFRGDRFSNVLFENPGHPAHFLDLHLTGRGNNREAIGARVGIVVETPDGDRRIHRAAGSVASFGGSPIGRMEIGLGNATRVKSLEVWWPRIGGSGTPSYTKAALGSPPMDTLLEIREGASTWKAIKLRRETFTR